jgi:hypothetical protein
MKKLIISLSVAALAFASVACASNKPAMEGSVAPAKYEIVDHKTMGLSDIPEWVTTYLSDGVRAVENMSQYKGKYVFIGEDSGKNKSALLNWVQNFNLAQDIAQMVSLRVKTKFAGAAAGSPDDEYGRYFENVVKNTADAAFSGARKETNFWILKRYYGPDKKTVEREEYDAYVLVTIDKATLDEQIKKILDGTVADKPLSKEQATAVDRVKEAFYEGF